MSFAVLEIEVIRGKEIIEEALDSLKAIVSAPIETKSSTPSPVQALLGNIAAGVIALIFYKFTATIEAALHHQTVSDNFSVCPLIALSMPVFSISSSFVLDA
ncbi:hypothetical protein REPUB_Repub05bG0069200 [Reevesia pubescens]